MRSIPVSRPTVLVAYPPHEALSEILQGMRTYLTQCGRRWRIRCVAPETFWRLLDSKSADAAFIAIMRDGGLPKRIAAFKIPLVNLLHDCHPIIPSVLSDEPAVGQAAAEYLLRRGYRNFAYIGFNSPWSLGRRDGFAQCLSAFRHHCCEYVSSNNDYLFLERPEVIRGVQKWIKGLSKPVAVLACADYIAASAVAICEDVGLRVPQDVAIMGVGNLVTTCELSPVPLSTVAVDFPRMSYEAARVLDQLLLFKKRPDRPQLISPAGVITRQSTEGFQFEDQYVSAAMRLIHDQAAESVTMKQLLRQIPVSRKWLDLQFKKLIGHTASQELREVRLERARDLLLHSKLSIRQIAYACGFAREENLTRFFRDGYGMPPGQYRNINAR